MVGGCARLVNMHVKRADGPVETVERDLSEYETRILLQALEYWDDCGRPLDDRSLEAFPLGSKEVEHLKDFMWSSTVRCTVLRSLAEGLTVRDVH